MKKVKKKKSDVRKKFILSEKQLERVKHEITAEACNKAGMLYLVALAEKGWNEDEIVDMFETVQRYIEYADEKLVKAKEVQEIIERKTGIVIKGKW